jgi:hypothetical protein
MGRHADRLALARDFGDGRRLRARRGGRRVRPRADRRRGVQIWCWSASATARRADAIGIARPGGAVGRGGVPQHTGIPGSLAAFYGIITVSGGLPPCAHTSTSCCPTSRRVASIPAACSTASGWTASRTATARWSTASRSGHRDPVSGRFEGKVAFVTGASSGIGSRDRAGVRPRRRERGGRRRCS